jgi:hypothetical protein
LSLNPVSRLCFLRISHSGLIAEEEGAGPQQLIENKKISKINIESGLKLPIFRQNGRFKGVRGWVEREVKKEK